MQSAGHGADAVEELEGMGSSGSAVEVAGIEAVSSAAAVAVIGIGHGIGFGFGIGIGCGYGFGDGPPVRARI
jgi:hypothetical protein